MLIRTILAFGLIALPAAAQQFDQRLHIRCNAHGAVVTVPGGPTYYMGRNCDAAQEGGGTGRWYLAASAFFIEIDGEAIRLEQDIGCDLPACWYDSQ